MADLREKIARAIFRAGVPLATEDTDPAFLLMPPSGQSLYRAQADAVLAAITEAGRVLIQPPAPECGDFFYLWREAGQWWFARTEELNMTGGRTVVAHSGPGGMTPDEAIRAMLAAAKDTD